MITTEQLREIQTYLRPPHDIYDDSANHTFLCLAFESSDDRTLGQIWEFRDLLLEFGLTDFSGALTFPDAGGLVDADYLKYAQSIRFMFLELIILALEDQNG